MNKLKLILLSSVTVAATIPMAMADVSIIETQTKQFIAKAKTLGSEKVEMTAVIKKWDEVHLPTVYTEILWRDVNVEGPGAVWQVADHLIMMESTLTKFNGGIQILTDNQHATASPLFVDPSALPTTNPPAVGTKEYIALANNPDSNPAGLVLDKPGYNKYTLPVAWTAKTSPKSIIGTDPVTSVRASDPNSGPEGPEAGPFNRFQWIYLLDRNTPAIDWNLNLQLGDTEKTLDIDLNGDGDKEDLIDTPKFENGNDDSTVIEAGRGLHVAQGPFFNASGSGKKTSYIYFEANFANAFASVPYKTSRLLLEAFTE